MNSNIIGEQIQTLNNLLIELEEEMQDENRIPADIMVRMTYILGYAKAVGDSFKKEG